MYYNMKSKTINCLIFADKASRVLHAYKKTKNSLQRFQTLDIAKAFQ